MKKIILSAILLSLLPLMALAEDVKITPANLNPNGHPTFDVNIDDATTDEPQIGNVVLPVDFATPGQENSRNVRSLKTSKEILPEALERARKEKLDDIFSQEITRNSNVFVDPEIEDNNLIFRLSKPNDTSIYKTGAAPFPLLDFYAKDPVIFHAKGGKVSLISANGESVIDTSPLLSDYKEKDFQPLARISIKSPATSRLYNTRIMFLPEKIIMQFKWSNETTTLPILADFKVFDQAMFLLDGKNEIPVKIFPVDIKDLVNSAAEKNKGLAVQGFELDAKDGRGFYRVRFQEPIKYFGFVPGVIISEIQFDASGANPSQAKRPWYAMFGSTLDLAQTFSFIKNNK